jgi:hypothetical protein
VRRLVVTVLLVSLLASTTACGKKDGNTQPAATSAAALSPAQKALVGAPQEIGTALGAQNMSQRTSMANDGQGGSIYNYGFELSGSSTGVTLSLMLSVETSAERWGKQAMDSTQLQIDGLDALISVKAGVGPAVWVRRNISGVVYVASLLLDGWPIDTVEDALTKGGNIAAVRLNKA